MFFIATLSAVRSPQACQMRAVSAVPIVQCFCFRTSCLTLDGRFSKSSTPEVAPGSAAPGRLATLDSEARLATLQASAEAAFLQTEAELSEVNLFFLVHELGFSQLQLKEV